MSLAKWVIFQFRERNIWRETFGIYLKLFWITLESDVFLNLFWSNESIFLTTAYGSVFHEWQCIICYYKLLAYTLFMKYAANILDAKFMNKFLKNVTPVYNEANDI